MQRTQIDLILSRLCMAAFCLFDTIPNRQAILVSLAASSHGRRELGVNGGEHETFGTYSLL